jgi:hypothetical protein
MLLLQHLYFDYCFNTFSCHFLFNKKQSLKKPWYNTRCISCQAPTIAESGGGGMGDVVLDDVENVVVDRLAIFSTNGAKRLKTTTTTIADLAQIEDNTTSSTAVRSSSKTNDELLSKSGGNIAGNSIRNFIN